MAIKKREILFRGKPTSENKWVYGYLLGDIYGAVPVIMSHQAVDDAFNLEFEYEHVCENTVGQFSGLTDKRGQRIFEGDIVRYPFDGKEQEKFIVQFVDGAFLAVPPKGHCKNKIWKFLIGGETENILVVGNIHDNPDLWEVPDGK